MFKKLFQKWKADMDTPASEVDLFRGLKTQDPYSIQKQAEDHQEAMDRALYGGFTTPPNGKFGVPWDGSIDMSE
ncbi:hypothetical protein [Celerinatantimonas sp. YJH-8]|uniref:hypothetical protein n=1 Tax=Celerinatantimonas sp. YJH-8 TaxID=3228714 RepID=UPI0038C9BE4D